MEKNLKKYTYISIKWNHFAIYLKLKQPCKLTIPQKKKCSITIESNIQDSNSKVVQPINKWTPSTKPSFRCWDVQTHLVERGGFIISSSNCGPGGYCQSGCSWNSVLALLWVCELSSSCASNACSVSCRVAVCGKEKHPEQTLDFG